MFIKLSLSFALMKWDRMYRVNIEQSLRDLLKSKLRYNKECPITESELDTMNIRYLYLVFWNWFNRFISLKPRKVHISKELQANPLYEQFHEGIADIIAKLEQGVSLSSRLSKGTHFGYEAESSASTQDKDLLLSDWGFHHLHLGINIDSSGYYKRHGQILFLKITDTDAYLINIGPHQFADKELVRVFLANWPDTNLFYDLRFPESDENLDFTPEELNKCRKSGMTAPVILDRKAWISNRFMSRAGISTEMFAPIDLLFNHLENIRQTLVQSEAEVIAVLRANGVEHDDFVIELADFNGLLGLVDKNSGTQIFLDLKVDASYPKELKELFSQN